MNITGNTIFIPGATSGIGLGLGLRFHELGNTIIIGGRRTELLHQITTDQPGIHTIEIDTSDPGSITAATAEVLAGHPDLNVLIPMAGIMLPEDLHSPDYLEVAERTVATNLLGPIRLIAAFTPYLATQESSAILHGLLRSGVRPAADHTHLRRHQGSHPFLHRSPPRPTGRHDHPGDRARPAGSSDGTDEPGEQPDGDAARRLPRRGHGSSRRRTRCP